LVRRAHEGYSGAAHSFYLWVFDEPERAASNGPPGTSNRPLRGALAFLG
jgi:hypothetical protein